MCTFGTKFPNIDNWNYISKFCIWYLEMDVHFQKSIFGILVPNGPYKKVLPKYRTRPNILNVKQAEAEPVIGLVIAWHLYIGTSVGVAVGRC